MLGVFKDRKSQSSLKIGVDGCPLYSASRMQKARAHSSGEAEYYAAASTTSEALLFREVLLFMGLEARAELLLDSGAARGICRSEGVGTTRHLSTKVHWVQLVECGLVMVGACTSAEHRADLGTKSSPVRRLRQLRQWNGLVLDRNETSVNGDEKEGQDEDGQQGAAAHTIAAPGQGDGGVLDALGGLARATRGTK